LEARLLPYRGILPRLAPDAFVAPGATLIGDVELGEQASVWFGCVVRGDVAEVRIGARTNLQDGSIIHVSRKGLATRIGVGVTIGHGCIVHACTLEDRAFVGMGSIVLDGARIEREGMLGAGALLSLGKCVGSRELWLGRPARFVRRVSDDERAELDEQNQHYVELAAEYRAALHRSHGPVSRG
jgi:carbonic anhydrase/acetyltransferase-like protein (isoleucine patch superfamily)